VPILNGIELFHNQTGLYLLKQLCYNSKFSNILQKAEELYFELNKRNLKDDDNKLRADEKSIWFVLQVVRES